MKAVVFALVLTIVGCSDYRYTVGTGVFTGAALACDWNSTRNIRTKGTWETNPILGQTPSSNRVDGYFIGIATLAIGVTIVLSSRWRPVFLGALGALETMVDIQNSRRLGADPIPAGRWCR